MTSRSLAVEAFTAPASLATIATREELVAARTLTAVVDDVLEQVYPLPEDHADLPAGVMGVLGPDERDLWSTVEQSGRERLLARAARRRVTSAERRLHQLERQDLCAHYIDLLCRLSETRRSVVGDDAYDALRAEFDAAKAAWSKVRSRSRRPKVVAATLVARQGVNQEVDVDDNEMVA